MPITGGKKSVNATGAIAACPNDGKLADDAIDSIIGSNSAIPGEVLGIQTCLVIHLGMAVDNDVLY